MRKLYRGIVPLVVVKRTERLRLPNWLEKLLYVSLAGLLMYLPFHAFLSTWGGTHIGPLWLWKSWKDIVIFIETLVVLGWLGFHSSVLKSYLRQRLWQMLAAFVAAVLLLTIVWWEKNGLSATLAGLAMDLRYFVVFFLGFVLIRFGSFSNEKTFAKVQKYIVGIGVVIALFGLLQVSLVPRDFLSSFGYEKGVTIAPYLEIDAKSPELIRAFATLRGPNDYGAYLVMALLFTLAVPMSRRIKILILGIIAAGIIVSFSRSALLAMIVAVGTWGFLRYGKALRPYILPLFLAALVGGGIALAAALANPTIRLLVFHSSEHDSHLTEGNLDDHASAKVRGVQRVAANPLGCGAGCSGPASYYGSSPKISENYYLQIAEEYGIVGVMAWLGITTAAVIRLLYSWKQRLNLALFSTFAGLSVIGLFLHVWADDPLSMTWWLIAGAIIGYSEVEHLWNKSKNNSRSKTL